MATHRTSAREFVDLVVDEGTFQSWNRPAPAPADPVYAAELAQARERSGLDEAVLTGRARLDGHEVVLVVGEFAFLGGSVGHATSDLVLRAVTRATDARLPLLVAPCSGGTRMQEGTAAFVQMVKIAHAVQTHRRAGLPYLVHLRHPTTGGVLASWGSLGQYTTAEPGALVGFLGPRAQQAITGEQLPEGVQRAENLQSRGIVDAVVPDAQLRGVWARLLAALGTPAVEAPSIDREDSTLAVAADSWEAVQASRQDQRPGLAELVHWQASDVVWFSGAGDGTVDGAVRAGLARIAGRSVVLVGHDRTVPVEERAVTPAGLRLAQRAYRLAAELGLAVVNVIDTPGAALSQQAEEGALAAEIARTLGLLAELEVPTVSVLLGQGGGGAALALLPADRTLCAANGWLAPLPPEGASAILHRDGSRADEMARRHRLSAADLHADGVVHEVLGEPSPMDGEVFSAVVAEAVGRHLAELEALEPALRLELRHERFRLLG